MAEKSNVLIESEDGLVLVRKGDTTPNARHPLDGKNKLENINITKKERLT